MSTVPISGNSCSIITIMPMGVECIAIPATTIYSNDGQITLLISGGTSPYTVSWSNGMQGKTIDNLGVGTYSATIVDYYGDYTATTSCSVSYSTFYLDKFVKCEYGSATGSTIFISQINSPTYGLIYTLSGITGCYEYNGIGLYTGQTYSALTVTSVYDDCDTCDPPVPVYTPPDLCLQSPRQGIYYQFVYSGTDINGWYVWSGASSMTIHHNTILSQWEVNNWVGTGTLILQTSITIPTGSWTHTGLPQGDWEVVTGTCLASPLSLTMEITAYPETCQGAGDGSAVLICVDGTAPYQYRVQGVGSYPAYQSSGLFTNLTNGTYTAEVKDANGVTGTQTFDVLYNGQPTTYYLTLSQTNVNSNISSTSISKSYEYNISVSPSLPVGRQLTFDVVLTRVKTENNNGMVTFNDDFSIIKNNISETITTSAPSTSTSSFCTIYTTTVTTDTQYKNSLTMIDDDIIYGQVKQGFDLSELPIDCNCKLSGTYYTVLSLENITIIGDNCEVVSQNVNSISETITKSECQ